MKMGKKKNQNNSKADLRANKTQKNGNSKCSGNSCNESQNSSQNSMNNNMM